jgi:hypothetical protein
MVLAMYGVNFLCLCFFRLFPGAPYMIFMVVLAFFPSSGYLDTIRLMIVDQSPDPYNLPLVMMVSIAQAMKLLFYFYERYATMVLGQTLTVFGCAILLTLLRFKCSRNPLDGRVFRLPELSHILWIAKATSFLEHLTIFAIYCLAIFIVFLIGFSVLGRRAAVDLLGLIANLTETFISIRFFIKVVVRRDVRNISNILVIQYVSGDFMKLVIFTFVPTPWVFVFGAFCQFSIDLVMSITFFCLIRNPLNRAERLQDTETFLDDCQIET